jgi:hypothetical protein
MTQYITRAYNTFTFDHGKSTIRKHSQEDRLAQEAEYYHSLPPHLSIYFPRLISSGFEESSKKHFLELELYPYENLGKLLINGSLSKDQWEQIAKHLEKILAEFRATQTSEPLDSHLRAMYLDKTEGEYKKLVEGFAPFRELSKEPEFTLNGKKYRNFENIWPEIKEKYSKILLNPEITPSVIHGDFCFSNILVGFLPDGKTILRFVDPRGKFGKLTMYGDPYYDLAKLMHSTDVGYEYFIYDKFTVEQTGTDEFVLAYHNQHKEEVHKLFHDYLYGGFNTDRIKLIQATIYVGMCARHYDSAHRQMAMYLSGVKLLNELL